MIIACHRILCTKLERFRLKVQYCTVLILTALCLKWSLSSTETAVDRQIPFPLSSALHVNGEKNGQPLLHDFTEDIQFMDIEDSSG